MALDPGVITPTVTSEAANTLISQMVQSYLTETAVLIPTIMDRSSEVKKGDTQVKYLKVGGLEAESKSSGSDYTAQKYSITEDTLVLDDQEGVYVEMETKADLDSVITQEPYIFQRAADALVQKLEADVYTALANVSTSNPDHAIEYDSASVLALSDILECRRLLNIAKLPPMERFLAIHPNNETDLLGLDQFLHADKYGSNTVLMNGEIGRIFGFTVLVTTNVTENTSLAYHRSHAVFARQQQVTWERDRNLKGDKHEFLLQTFYGLKTLDSGIRGVKLANA